MYVWFNATLYKIVVGQHKKDLLMTISMYNIISIFNVNNSLNEWQHRYYVAYRSRSPLINPSSNKRGRPIGVLASVHLSNHFLPQLSDMSEKTGLLLVKVIATTTPLQS